MLPFAQADPTEANLARYRNWCADTGEACGHPGNAVTRVPLLGSLQTIVVCRCVVCGHGWMEVDDD